jgi:hypothetical protein
MNRLVQAIEALRARLEKLRQMSLKETPTRTIVIDPLLEALGWDVRDPEEVQLEYPTVDGKSVDYALKLNRRPALLVEAKSLDDPLTDVKAITQVVGYAANDGIVWCILTSGVRWKVYRSVERCQAPDKLMFEVSLDPKDSEGLSVTQLAQQMWRFSRDEMARGTLDALGEQTFTDGKVRKALDAIMRDPPRPFLKMMRSAVGEASIPPQRIKESLARIWKGAGFVSQAETLDTRSVTPDLSMEKTDVRSVPAGTHGRKGKKPRRDYAEAHHISGKPQEVLELYRAIDRLCFSLKPGSVEKHFLAKSVNYEVNGRAFCAVHLQQSGLRVWLWLKYNRIENPPAFARDVSNIGHWGGGDLELGISSLAQIDEAANLIRMSFEGRA